MGKGGIALSCLKDQYYRLLGPSMGLFVKERGGGETTRRRPHLVQGVLAG